MIVIGTKALEYHGIYLRESKDWDYAVETNLRDGNDCIILPPSIIKLIPEVNLFATPDAVFTIKCSHLGWDIKWEKHLRDVLRLKLQHQCKIIPELFDALFEHWKKVNGNKPQLDFYKSKIDFFDDAVTKVYDHDYLHVVVSDPFPPMYTRCLEDGCEVAIDRGKFESLSFQNKVRFFKEEIAVIAMERWMIVHKFPLQQSWRWAVQKVVTALTKDWMTEWLIKNIEQVIVPDKEYFSNAYNLGIIEDMTKYIDKDEFFTTMMEEIGGYKGYSPNKFMSCLGYDVEHPLFELLDSYGGESMGEDYWIVFKWKDSIYKLSTTYYSYDGVDWDDADLYEVKPVPVMRTEYVHVD